MPLRQFAPLRKANSSHLDHELKLIRSCEIMAALTLLRGRWKIPIVWQLREDGKTLPGLRRLFVTASEKMLSQHLAELMRDGFVDRRQCTQDRRMVSYTLTGLGQSLIPVLETLRQWGAARSIIPRATLLLEASIQSPDKVRS